MTDEDESFEQIPGQFNPEPDHRLRPHRPADPIIKCPNCEEQTLQRIPFSKMWVCPECDYREER